MIFDFWNRRAEIVEVFKRAIADGKLNLNDKNETVVSAAFEDVPKVWMRLFEGGNTGKLVTRLVE